MDLGIATANKHLMSAKQQAPQAPKNGATKRDVANITPSKLHSFVYSTKNNNNRKRTRNRNIIRRDIS
jgi:hypothetical protein